MLQSVCRALYKLSGRETQNQNAEMKRSKEIRIKFEKGRHE